VSDAPTVQLRHTKTFKLYTDEFDARVVEHVRAFAKARPAVTFHEDKSIVKVTSTSADIRALLDDLKTRFNYIPPEDREEKKADEPAAD
jgi:hypothetical protein